MSPWLVPTSATKKGGQEAALFYGTPITDHLAPLWVFISERHVLHLPHYPIEYPCTV
jgi:hypothetical protein